MFKLENLHKRPTPFNTHDIGVWAKVMEVMSYLGAVSNIFLFAFGNEQPGCG